MLKSGTGRLSESFSGEGLKAQLLRGGFGSLLVVIAANALGLGAAVALARLLGAEAYGLYSFVFAIITLLAIPAQLGLPNLVIRETAKAQAEARWDTIRGLWRWSSAMTLSTSIALAVIGGAATWLLADRGSGPQLSTMLWGLALIPLVALGNLRGAALRGLRHVVQGQLPEFILRPSFLIVFALIFSGVGTFTAEKAMMLHVAASAIAFVVGAVLLLRARPPDLRLEAASKTHGRTWLASAVPLALIQGTLVISQNSGVLALGVFRDDAEVGVYRVALQGATLVAFGLSVANVVVAPHVARLYAMRDMVRLQRLATASARIGLLVALPTALSFLVFGREILALLFGERFAAGYAALAILTFGQLASAFVASVGALLNMTGHERDVAGAVGLSTICNVAMTLILVPPFGMSGAAVASAIGTLIWAGVLWWQVQRRIGIDSSALGHRRQAPSSR